MKLYAMESVIFAENFDALVEWYQRVLGFRVMQLYEDEYHYCVLENETGIKIGIASAIEMSVTPGDRKNNTVVLQFQVEDVPRFFEYLQEHGGKISFGPSFDKKDHFWYGGFTDIEGNPFWLVDKNCP